jgi:hypothetical protein
MRGFFRHPVVIFASGAVVGMVFSSQLATLPGLSKLPKK